MKIQIEKWGRGCIKLSGDLLATGILRLSQKGISPYDNISGQSNLCLTEEEKIEVEE